MLVFVSFSLQEIEKQILTDVTHLEIPADLALVFANIQGKNPTLTQGQTIKSLDYEILSKSYFHSPHHSHSQSNGTERNRYN